MVICDLRRSCRQESRYSRISGHPAGCEQETLTVQSQAAPQHRKVMKITTATVGKKLPRGRKRERGEGDEMLSEISGIRSADPT